MRNRLLPALWVGMSFLSTACDDGRISEQQAESYEEGYTVRLTGSFRGVDGWADGYSVVLAGFSDDSSYALISKALPLSQTDGEGWAMDLNGIGSEVDELRLCAVNRLRESVCVFRSWRTSTFSSAADTIRLEVEGRLDVGMYAGLQREVFDRSCTACHGAAGRPAAALSLLPEVSHSQLVEVPSSIWPDSLRVSPGSADGSVLWQMLSTDMSQSLGIDHSDMLPAAGLYMKLVKDWIDYGARE